LDNQHQYIFACFGSGFVSKRYQGNFEEKFGRNAYEELKLRQKWKWKINPSKQTNKSRNTSAEENKSCTLYNPLPHTPSWRSA
jgi:hypothetical protein